MAFSTGITSLDIISGTLACILVFSLISRSMRGKPSKGLSLPPGPPGRFLIGSAADIPKGPIWKAFDQWAKEYGEIVHIKLLGKSIILVNSLDIAHDLFEKRSAIYSDRPHSHMLCDLMGWGWNFGMMQYGDLWRRHRKMFHQNFSPEVAGAYNDIETRQARAFLCQLNESPAEFLYHIRHLVGAIIMEIVYGIKVLPKGDPYLKTAEVAAAIASDAAVPGKFFVDIFPFLKYVPEWMPGAGFQRIARESRLLTDKMSVIPLNVVKDGLASGTAQPSVAARLLEDLSRKTDAPSDEETLIRNVAGVAYAAGADTTASSLTSFILAMVLFPEIQRKAQSELDSVVGDRLPDFADLESLPYIMAVCKEIHRWHPTLPLGIGHLLKQDDIYGEYFIPGGSVVMGNAWTILHDEELYGPNTGAFEPERFLRPGAIDPVGQFGFGRRICAGRYVADDSITIVVASILKVFDISLARDPNGDEIPVKGSYKSGFISHPDPFLCTIQPRSESARALLLSVDD